MYGNAPAETFVNSRSIKKPSFINEGFYRVYNQQTAYFSLVSL